MSLATVTASPAPNLADLVDAVSARTGAWLVVERLGAVLTHGTGAGECPPAVAASLLRKSTAPLRTTVTWTRRGRLLRGTVDGVGLTACHLGDGATAWFVDGPVEEMALPLLAAAVQGDQPLIDSFVAELLHPRGLSRRGRAPQAVLLAVRADEGVARRLAVVVAGTSARVHTEGDVVLVALLQGEDPEQLLRQVPDLRAGLAEVSADASDWVAAGRLATGALAAAGELGIALADPSDPLVAAELVVQEAQEAVADLARQLPQAPLRRLEEHDSRTSGELVASLTAWCRAGFDVPAAAAALHVHVNTLRYRLKRAAEVSGLDVAQPRQLLALQLLLSV